MNNLLNPLVESGVQCWSCPIFDRLFQVISSAAGAVYHQFSLFCGLIFVLILTFYILYAVWKNIRSGVEDPMYQKSIKPVLINSLFVFALLGLGVQLPRFITTITFEPVADMTLIYAHTMVNTDIDTVNQKVTYEPKPMDDSGFYRPQLRDKIVLLMKTTITQFQGYIKLGIAIMDKAFSWNALLGVGVLIKHIIMFAMGLYLAYEFFRLFIRFCFYFVDTIVAMTFFAFFFPLSVVMFAFRDSNAPGWVKDIGKNLGADRFKSVINSIITLASAVLTYTVIMVIIAKFFSGDNASTVEIMEMITSGQIFADALSDDNLAMLTLSGCIVLVYLINFLSQQIPEVTKMVLTVFNVQEEHKLGDQLADDAFKLTGNIVKTVKDIGKTILSKDDKKDDTKK